MRFLASQNLFAPSEILKKVLGTTGEFQGATVVTSLTFVTNVKTYGPYGNANGTPFSYPERSSDEVVGFYGRNGSLLDAIGVYVRPSAAN